MKSLSYIGKLIYALPLVVFGLHHFMNASSLATMVPAIFPAPEVWVYLTGLALILASVAIIINKKARLATLLLGIMLLLFAFLIHFQPFLNQEPQGASFLKDMALAGAAFIISSHSKN